MLTQDSTNGLQQCGGSQASEEPRTALRVKQGAPEDGKIQSILHTRVPEARARASLGVL